MKEPHPANDGRTWGFNKHGFLRPLRGPKPNTSTPFGKWMKGQCLTNHGLSLLLRCNQRTVARWRAGGAILRPYAERLLQRWPSCPIKVSRQYLLG
ncbi:MAG: hypothetical protein AABY75_03950 [Bacteroidota bacterium]